MKKLKSLIVILFLICSSISSSVTAQNKAVILDSITANKVVIDLIGFDVCEAEKTIYIKKLEVADKKEAVYLSDIVNLEKQTQLLRTAFSEKEKESGVLNKIIKNNESVIRKEKRKKIFWKIATYVFIGTTGYFAVR